MAIATETGRAEQARWETDISGDIAPGDPLTDVLGVVTAADTRAIQGAYGIVPRQWQVALGDILDELIGPRKDLGA